MLRNLVFFTLLWFSLLLSILLFIPFGIVWILGGREPAHRFAGLCTHYWGKYVLFLSGTRLEVEEKKYPPGLPPDLVLSNHQSYMDIPVLMSLFRFPLSFVAKKELIRLPFINLWILALDCDLIERKMPAAVFRKMQSEVYPDRGKTRLIFPEGTRSQSAEVGKIHEGLIRMATEKGLRILPVHIQGSYQIFEEKGKIRPGRVSIRIFPVSDKYDLSGLKDMLSGKGLSNNR